jgi:hypothetical protein
MFCCGTRQQNGAFKPKSPSARHQLANGYHFRDTIDRLHRTKTIERSDKAEVKLRPVISPRRHIMFPGSRVGQ